MNKAGFESQGGANGKGIWSDRKGEPILGPLLGIGGAVVGGFVGYWLFFVIAKQGFYALALPGVFIGLGCGALSGRKSTCLGIICGILGLAAGILAEWRFAPFAADDSLSYFLMHFHKNSIVTLVLIAIGAICAFYFGRGRKGGAWLRRQKPPIDQSNPS
ncbi:MAG: hypothetical protein KAY65_08220 [Planctomycetes bacterium]|nr:hypothetical protein [Planctomycetota bacterium]